MFNLHTALFGGSCSVLTPPPWIQTRTSEGSHTAENMLNVNRPQHNEKEGPSLVAQRWRICLPTQGTQVRSLVQEDSTHHEATRPVCCNHRAHALAPVSQNYWTNSRAPGPRPCNERRHCTKPRHCNEERAPLQKALAQQDPAEPKRNKSFLKKEKGKYQDCQRTAYLKHGFGVRQIFSLVNFNICLRI